MTHNDQFQVLVNQWKTPDGTILRSRHRHDAQFHTDNVTGVTYMIDGGSAYTRISGNPEDLIWCGCYVEDPIEVIRECFEWGSYGVNGDQPKRYVLLKNMSEDHIKAVLKTQRHIFGTPIEDVFKMELTYRGITDV
jgi:hypothetical protein